MNKPLLPAYERKRASWREIVLALLALGCAAGWLNERTERHTSDEVQQFVNGLQKIRHNPGEVVNVTIFEGAFPISCRMQRFDTTPQQNVPLEQPAAADSADHAEPAETTDAAQADAVPEPDAGAKSVEESQPDEKPAP